MPRPLREWVCIARRSLPSKSMVPLLALSKPMMLFISVVLPAPLRPIKPVMPPVGSVSDTSRRICTDWIETFRCSTLSIARALLVQPLQRAANHEALDLRVVERDLRRCVGDDLAVVKREHPLGEAAHDFH